MDALKAAIKGSGLSVAEMVETAWASASTFRGSDKRGGANGARIRLAPQKDWEANKPDQLTKVLASLNRLQQPTAPAWPTPSSSPVASASKRPQACPFRSRRPWRRHGRANRRSVLCGPRAGFLWLPQLPEEELRRDARRNDVGQSPTPRPDRSRNDGLVGGLRSLGVSSDDRGLWGSGDSLDNSFFTTLLDMNVAWTPTGSNSYQAKNRATGEDVRTASRYDLVFGSNSQLRAIAEVYAQDDNNGKFVNDFIAAWNKVMNADRFDVA